MYESLVSLYIKLFFNSEMKLVIYTAFFCLAVTAPTAPSIDKLNVNEGEIFPLFCILYLTVELKRSG